MLDHLLASVAASLTMAHANDMWYAFPLIVTISLVYAATRQEQMEPILWAAARFGGWICVFMAIAYGILYTISANL